MLPERSNSCAPAKPRCRWTWWAVIGIGLLAARSMHARTLAGCGGKLPGTTSTSRTRMCAWLARAGWSSAAAEVAARVAAPRTDAKRTAIQRDLVIGDSSGRPPQGSTAAAGTRDYFPGTGGTRALGE